MDTGAPPPPTITYSYDDAPAAMMEVDLPGTSAAPALAAVAEPVVVAPPVDEATQQSDMEVEQAADAPGYSTSYSMTLQYTM